MISYNFLEIKVFDLDTTGIDIWLLNLIEKEGFKLSSVNFIFCSDDYLLRVNNTYLEHDYYTDVITFDYNESDFIIGDVYISVDRVADNAISYNVSFLNELLRVIVHGVLHLCGYKDKTQDESLLMKSKEDFYLSVFVSRET